LLLQMGLAQAVTFVLRPTMSYRALELDVSPAWLGAISGSFAVLPVLAAVHVGRATDHRGERPVLMAGSFVMLASALGFVLLGGSVPLLVMWSGLLGLGQLLMLVAGQSLVARLWPDDRRDGAFGHYAFAASAGQTVGPLLIAVLGGGGTSPHTAPVFAGGLGLAALLVGVAATVRPGPREPHPPGSDRQRVPLRSVLRVPGLGRAMLASLTVLAAIDILLVYLPALGQELGIAARTIAILLGVRAAASALSRFFMGALVRRVGRDRLLVATMASSGLAIGLLAVDLPVVALAVLVLVAGFGLGVGQPLTLSWVAGAAPPRARGTVLGVRLIGNRLGQAVVPGAVGLVASSSGVAGVLWVTAGSLGVVAATTARRGPVQAADVSAEPD
jgi:MFS family permease